MRTPTLKLTWHKGSGYWCKSIGGKLRYFGARGATEDDARKALLEFLQRRAYDRPDPVAEGGLVLVKTVANAYAADCQRRVEAGTLQGRTFEDYDTAIKQFVEAVGRLTAVEDLTPAQFAAVRADWLARYAPSRAGNFIQSIKTMFKWAGPGDGMGLIQGLPRYGREFSKPPVSAHRDQRRDKARNDGERKFGRKELRAILESPLLVGQHRAFFLLGLNAGCYAASIADFTWGDLRQEGRLHVIDTTRRKTGVPQKFVLWPETLRAITDCRKRGADDALVFTTPHGLAWVCRDRHTDSIGQNFGDLLRTLRLKRSGVGFGSLRHTHVSAVAGHGDKDAARLVRGHAVPGVVWHYDFPDVGRLKAITDLARGKLLG
jgi:integrase